MNMMQSSTFSIFDRLVCRVKLIETYQPSTSSNSLHASAYFVILTPRLKTIIYIDFCIRKSTLLFWGALSWGGSQNANFQRAGLRTPIKRATVPGPSEEFQKEPQYICIYGYWLQSELVSSRLLPKPAVPPTKYQQNGHFCSTRGDFLVSVTGTAVFGRRRHEARQSSSSGAELKLYQVFLKIPPTG